MNSRRPSFQAVRLVGLEAASNRTMSGEPARICLRLSAPPPYGWSHLFTQVWRAMDYPGKCPAGMETGAVWLDCRPEELASVHLQYVEQAIALTNARHRDKLAAQAADAAQQLELQRQLEAKLRDVGQAVFPAGPAAEPPMSAAARIKAFLAAWWRILFIGKKP